MYLECRLHNCDFSCNFGNYVSQWDIVVAKVVMMVAMMVAKLAFVKTYFENCQYHDIPPTPRIKIQLTIDEKSSQCGELSVVILYSPQIEMIGG